jgi:acetylornithine deacetylase/succinyl-diaminopimelate desuccinylase-like protein
MIGTGGVRRLDMDNPLYATLAKMAEELQKQHGPDVAIVLMVGTPAEYRFVWRGNPLAIEGLVSLCMGELRASVWDKTQSPSPKALN